MSKNKTTIKITGSPLHPAELAQHCERLFHLRTARKIGDVETINNTVLGTLKRHPLSIQYEVVQPAESTNFYQVVGKPYFGAIDHIITTLQQYADLNKLRESLIETLEETKRQGYELQKNSNPDIAKLIKAFLKWYDLSPEENAAESHTNLIKGFKKQYNKPKK